METSDKLYWKIGTRTNGLKKNSIKKDNNEMKRRKKYTTKEERELMEPSDSYGKGINGTK